MEIIAEQEVFDTLKKNLTEAGKNVVRLELDGVG